MFLSSPPTNFNISIFIISNTIEIMKKKASVGLASLAKQALKENTKRRPLRERGEYVFEMEVDIEDIEFTLTFEFIPGERSSYDNPGSGDSVDIRSLEFKGVDFWNFIYEIHKNPKKFEKELEEKAMEHAYDMGDGSLEDEYDDWRDRQL